MVSNATWAASREKIPEKNNDIKDADDSEKSVPTWQEFTENTTFHGIRYIFQDTGWCRKCFWLMIILGSAVFFMVQVGYRVGDYWKYQTVTSSRRMSAQRLVFPAVTFCNLNQFRISEAYTMGLYDYLNQQLDMKDILRHPFVGGLLNTSNIIRRLGHHLPQLIDSCMWNGEACDRDRDFQTRLLDIGLCHTFNMNRNATKLVDKEGIISGLRLLLNIEEYEHMKGSSMDSGVKFLLHDPEDTPSLTNLGFVAASGLHTFVSIKPVEVSSLPSPWGNCTEGGALVSTCKHKCLTQDYIAHCGCTDIYMTSSDQWPQCDLGTTLTRGCVLHSKGGSTCGGNCSCPSPCHSVHYRPTLSSSSLSAVNLNKFALSAPGQLEETRASFLKASEIQLTVNPTTNNSVLTPTSTILLAISSIQHIMQHYNTQEELSYMKLLLPFALSMYKSSDQFEPALLLQGIKDTLDGEECNPHAYRIGWFLDTAVKLLHYTKQIHDINVTHCADTQFYTGGFSLNQGCRKIYRSSKISEDVCNFCPTPVVVLNFTLSVDTCNGYYPHCACCYAGYLAGRQAYINEIPYLDFYNLNTYLPYHGIINGDGIEAEGELCHNLTDFYMKHQVLLRHLLSNVQMLNGTSVTFDDFITFIDDTNEATSGMFPLLVDGILKHAYTVTCCWQKNYLNLAYVQQYITGIKYTDVGIMQEKVTYDEAVYRFDSLALERFMEAVNALVESEHAYSSDLVTHVTQTLGDYLTGGNVTSRQLALLITDSQVYRELTALAENMINALRALHLVHQSLEGFLENMGDLLVAYQNKRIPLTWSYKVLDSPLYRFLGDPGTEAMLGMFNTDDCEHVDAVYDAYMKQSNKISCTFAPLVAKDIIELEKSLTDLSINYDNLYVTLKEYLKQTEMNKDFYMCNFLQVDLYYEELEYELIEEQKAFVLGSLFSEVGGFLGLLLGASIITVCELVDYLILLVSRRLKNNTVNSEGKKSPMV